MFSTNQIEYIKTFLPTYANQGYKYYIAYTNNDSSSSYYNTDPDLYILFSKDKIEASSGYRYSVNPEETIIISIRTGNYSSSNNANNTERVVVNQFVNDSFFVDEWEHIYTNAEFGSYVLQPDYNLISGGETNVRLEAITFVLLVSLLITIGSKLFRRR